jgi:hypothetical protein
VVNEHCASLGMVHAALHVRYNGPSCDLTFIRREFTADKQLATTNYNRIIISRSS